MSRSVQSAVDTQTWTGCETTSSQQKTFIIVNSTRHVQMMQDPDCICHIFYFTI